ncbi:MAG: PINc/VapC family ATPase [Thermoplasmata archaeon]
MKFVPDTSVIINGKFYELLESMGGEVILPEAVISEIEAQANRGLLIGFTGLKELEKIKELENSGKIRITFYGKRPEKWQIEKAKSGEIDDIIRNAALENDAELVTSDYIQSVVAKIKGIKIRYIEIKKPPEIRIEDFFDERTMSVHLKENTLPRAKKGSPGNFVLVNISDKILTREELEEISTDIIERARSTKNSYIEIETKGATVVQLSEYRIVITKEPFSDGIEITAVKPLVKLDIDYYKIDEKLMNRIKNGTNGILISGSPGAGKTTFAQALAEWYAKNGKIVKTMEKPRDLQVIDEITQYTSLEGDMSKTGNILLMVRPDITIFDEVRTTEDFIVYADLRLAGVGMVGIVHATKAIDAIQRLIGRVELGVIPQVVDTVIHIEAGKISKILILEYVVKIPSGLKEEDLARPVIEIRDYYTGIVEYEIYSFGEQIVVVPVTREKSSIYKLAEERLEELLKNYIKDVFRVEIVGENTANLYIRESMISEIIGKKGANIEKLEKVTGMHLEVYPFKDENLSKGNKIEVGLEKKKDYLLFVGREYAGYTGYIMADSEILFKATISKDGYIRIKSNSENSKILEKAIKSAKKLYFVIE